MKQFSIRDLEHLTGIKAHTIRVWEQRYAIINPKRTPTNIRYYTNEDLKFLLNISLLNKNGYKISKIAKMSEQEIKSNISTLSESELKYDLQIKSLTEAMIDINEANFEKIMSTNILQNGFETTMQNIIYPFLSRIGIMWVTGVINPAQEHFITNLIRQKIIVAIDGQIFEHKEHTKTYLLFLPESEQHEISLLYLSYLLKSRNHRVLYLGCNVPNKDILDVCNKQNPDFLYTFLTSSISSNKFKKKMANFTEQIADKKLFLAGRQALDIDESTFPNVQIIKSIEEAMSVIMAE